MSEQTLPTIKPAAIRGAFWMIGAIVAFSTMAVAGREILNELDTFELMLYRSIVGLLIVVPVALATGSLREVNTEQLPLQILRNLFHFTGQNLWFLALTLIPLAQVFAIEFTSPIWVLLFSPLLLGERLTRGRAIAACFGFIGILVVTRPTVETINVGIIAAALSAICFAMTNVLTRKLTRSQSITCIMVYLTATQTVFGLIGAGYDGHITIPSMAYVPAIFLVGLCGLVAHFCLTRALSIAPAPTVMPIDFARLPLIALIGFLFYDEGIDIYVFYGAAIIFTANYINLLRESRENTGQ
ncbi:DMT family transporter [Halocynthiibacter sp. C4]|uniref:DMT family transporter n=1 Tax=Halocynthiibacter sp. C4 TaxID=2992758 RepID=UPI00237A2B1E|nr:DMT family transporter [Halocynthiibacter sp. C4]MDE0589550.1 DMT family transporter [Halocynthiibacter sp. C4]